MGDVLLVSSKLHERDFFQKGLEKGDFVQTVAVSGGNEARRLLMLHMFDLIIINTPLRDEFGNQLAMDFVEQTSAVIIMVVMEGDDMWIAEEEAGIFILFRPLQENLFEQYIKLICLVNNRAKRISDENRRLQNQVNEIRIVYRAKCVLIQKYHMTEEEAHRYIEKQAMNRRITRLELSNEVVSGKHSLMPPK